MEQIIIYQAICFKLMEFVILEDFYRVNDTTLYNIERRKDEIEKNIIINKFQAAVRKNLIEKLNKSLVRI
jgi:penicillin-binding protein-related factor A (putative recombinase)